MKILTFTSLFPNSVFPLSGIFVHQRISHLARRSGNCVEVVAPVPYVPFWLARTRWGALRRVPLQEQIGDVTVHHPRYPLIPKISMPLHGWLMFLGSANLVARLHRRIHFDCIDAHYVYPDGFAAVLLGKLLKIPVFVTARGTDINLFRHFRMILAMIRWTLRRATGTVAVSKALKSSIVELGLSADSIRVIANGIDAGRFKPVAQDKARRELGMPQDGYIVLSVASLLPAKGLQYLIPAVKELLVTSNNVRLYIVGEGKLRPSLELLIQQLNLERDILLVGSRPNEELFLWFSAANVTCLPSSREGLPNVLLESLACGTPVVATRVGGIPEIITSEELGLLSDQDSHALAVTLDIALHKRWNREGLSQYGRYRTWELVAKELENYFALAIMDVKDRPAKIL